MVESPMFDVFLAHNSKDKPQVRAIANELRRRGLNPWLDEEQIPPGELFQDAIQKAIPQIKSAAICIGSEGLGKWQVMELHTLTDQFISKGIKVIPLLLPGVESIPENLLFLKQMNWVSFKVIEDVNAFNLLEWGITGVKPAPDRNNFAQLEAQAQKQKEEERIRQQQEAERLRQKQEAVNRSKVTELVADSKPTNKDESELREFEFEVVKVNYQSQEVKREKGQARYFTEDLGNGVELDMVYIPGGEFMMGSPEGEGYKSEKPQHKVTVQPFFMGKFQITQAQWRAITSLPKIKVGIELDPCSFKGDELPVETISWEDAVEFCQRLSIYTKKEYRLPTEAEWEYACRAGTTTTFHFGEKITDKLANYEFPKTRLVGSFLPNAFGLYDMHGNLWEWCEDDWHDNYQGAPTDGSAWLSRAVGNMKVIRGGSWYNDPELCRSAYRNLDTRDDRGNVIGFRVVCFVPRVLEEAEQPQQQAKTKSQVIKSVSDFESTKPNKNMKTIKIFLASSSELEDDRKDFEIFINRKNKEYVKDGVFLELLLWEDFIDAMSQTRLQDEYNKAIEDCDIFVSLFHTKVGKYTEEEFERAFKTFKASNKPLIYTYFKDEAVNMSQINDRILTLLNFKKKLSDLGHFYTNYADINELKYKFGEQLIKVLPKLTGIFPNKIEQQSSNENQNHNKIEQPLELEKEINLVRELTSAKRQELREILQNIFSNLSQFKRFLVEELDLNLSEIPQGESEADFFFNTIEYIKAEGRIEELVAAAKKARPKNLKIKQFNLFEVEH